MSGSLANLLQPIDQRAWSGASFLVGNPETGDFASAYWAGDMWALYCGPDFDTVQQLDFEPTHYGELAQ